MEERAGEGWKDGEMEGSGRRYREGWGGGVLSPASGRRRLLKPLRRLPAL